MIESITRFGVWDSTLLVGVILGSVLAAVHAILYKRDPRASLSWCLWILLLPGLGALTYFVFGVNRIQRKALRIRRRRRQSAFARCASTQAAIDDTPASAFSALVTRVTRRPLLGGNRLLPLRNGDQAYPDMLRAIENAHHSIGLCTYIFDWDRVGHEFALALSRAAHRGVEVRVLIDSVGSRYSWPGATDRLRRLGVRTETFLPVFNPFLISAFNLRTHRKVLTVDGKLAFTGGINIREGHSLDLKPRAPVRDLHFSVQGPVVSQLQEVFAEDWFFSAQERLEGEKWFPSQISSVGDTPMRAISGGPDQEFESTKWTILGALTQAQKRVEIVTPYFIPDSVLISALNVAAMRGVSVEITIPKRSNLPFVDWASRAQLWQVLDRGCRVFLSAEPFDHAKLVRVDGRWLLLGSTNWDARSLRLNFELDLECWGEEAASSVEPYLLAARRESVELKLQELQAISFAAKLRNGVMRLAAPFL